jgi:hypothetical protein
MEEDDEDEEEEEEEDEVNSANSENPSDVLDRPPRYLFLRSANVRQPVGSAANTWPLRAPAVTYTRP